MAVYALVSDCLNSLNEPPGEHSRNFGAYLGTTVTDVRCQALSLTGVDRSTYLLHAVYAGQKA